MSRNTRDGSTEPDAAISQATAPRTDTIPFVKRGSPFNGSSDYPAPLLGLKERDAVFRGGGRDGRKYCIPR